MQKHASRRPLGPVPAIGGGDHELVATLMRQQQQQQHAQRQQYDADVPPGYAPPHVVYHHPPPDYTGPPAPPIPRIRYVGPQGTPQPHAHHHPAPAAAPHHAPPPPPPPSVRYEPQQRRAAAILGGFEADHPPHGPHADAAHPPPAAPHDMAMFPPPLNPYEPPVPRPAPEALTKRYRLLQKERNDKAAQAAAAKAREEEAALEATGKKKRPPAAAAKAKQQEGRHHHEAKPGDTWTQDGDLSEPLTVACVVNQHIHLNVVVGEQLQHQGPSAYVSVHRDLANESMHNYPVMNGAFEMKFLLFANRSGAVEVPAGKYLHAVAILGANTKVDLGEVPVDRAQLSAVRVETLPRSVTVMVFLDSTRPVTPFEQILLDHCYKLLAFEPHMGSMSSSHLQNLARESHMYSKVIGKVFGHWSEFVDAHPERFHMFQYTADEVNKYGLFTTCRAKENRICAVEYRDHVVAGDIWHENEKVDAERKTFQFMHDFIGDGRVHQQDLLDALKKEESFVTVLQPNVGKMVRLAEAASRRKGSNVWVMRNNPLHGDTIEPKLPDPPGAVYGFPDWAFKKQVKHF